MSYKQNTLALPLPPPKRMLYKHCITASGIPEKI